jgi:hypothetical protein
LKNGESMKNQQLTPIKVDRENRVDCPHLKPPDVMGGVQYLGADFEKGGTVRTTVQLCPVCARVVFEMLETMKGKSYNRQ